MPEHRIRLRGGWEEVGGPGPEPASPRLTLPARWDPPGSPRTVRLRRRFGRPPAAAPGESVWLRLDRVPGLLSLRLNGSELAGEGGRSLPLEIPLGELPPRNELELVVPAEELARAPWGEIALVIRGDRAAGGPERPLA